MRPTNDPEFARCGESTEPHGRTGLRPHSRPQQYEHRTRDGGTARGDRERPTPEKTKTRKEHRILAGTKDSPNQGLHADKRQNLTNHVTLPHSPLLPPPTGTQMDSLKLAILNINGLTSPTQVAMLEAFVRTHALDILLLQEVTHPIFADIHGYNTFYNIEPLIATLP